MYQKIAQIVQLHKDSPELVDKIHDLFQYYYAHETHLDCLVDSIRVCVEDKYLMDLNLTIEQRVELGKFLCGEINDFKISNKITEQKQGSSKKRWYPSKKKGA